MKKKPYLLTKLNKAGEFSTLLNQGGSALGFTPENKEFITTWQTDNTGTSTDTQVTLPLISTGVYNFVVDWGDGNTDTITEWDDPALTHEYGVISTPTITIRGTITGWRFNNGGDRRKIITVEQWGPLVLNNDAAFYGCSKLSLPALDGLNLGVGNRYRTFRSCNSTTLVTVPGINKWITQGVTSLQEFFYDCNYLNQEITWYVPNLTSTWDMFKSSRRINKVCDLLGCETTLSDCEGMYENADDFNQRVPHMERPNVVFYLNEFAQSSADYTGIGMPLWKVDACGTLWEAFEGTQVNQNLNSWNVSNVQDLDETFRNTPMNQPFSNWDTSNVVFFESTFENTPIDQDFSNWDFSFAFVGANDMFLGCTLSVANYDALIISLAAQIPTSPVGIAFHGGFSEYSCEAEAAHALLSAHWTVTDGGLGQACGLLFEDDSGVLLLENGVDKLLT